MHVEWRADTEAPALEAYQQAMPPAAGPPDLPGAGALDVPDQVVVDRAAIHEQLLLTTRGIDRLDAALLDEGLGPDVTLRIGEHGMTGTEFLDRARADAPNRIATQHAVANHLVDVEGDHARSEAYLFGAIGYEPGKGPPHMTGTDGGVVLSGLRYVDSWRRVDGQWRLTERLLSSAWTTTLDLGPMTAFATDPHADGHRDERDPSYARATWARAGPSRPSWRSSATRSSRPSWGTLATATGRRPARVS